MNATPSCLLGSPDLPGPDAWPLSPPTLTWVVREARRRGVAVLAVEAATGWTPCAPEELLLGAEEAWVSQRPGCGGVLTTVAVHAGGRCRGAWLHDRAPGVPELPAWRALLLEAMVRDAR